MSPEKLERELLARLGLDTSATPEDVSTAHQAVSAYLVAAPRSLRAWARVQAAGADEAYALLTDPAALARAVALVGAGARPAVLPGEPATPPARRDTPAPAPVAVAPAATGSPAAARAFAAAALGAPARVDENGRRIVSDDEIDALIAEVDPTAHREVVGTAAERAASMAGAGTAPHPSRLLGFVGSPAFRNLALAGAAVALIGIVGVIGFNAGGTSAAGIGAGATAAPNASATAPVLDLAAVAALMEKIQANPKDADSLMALGDEYYQTGDFKTAQDWYTKDTAVEPTAVRGFLALGASAFNQGDSATALTSWTKVLALDDTNVEAHYDLGFLYLNQQPPDMAGVQREWTRVVELDPNSDLATTVKAHLDALASAAPASPGASAAPASPGASAAPSATSPSPAASPAPATSPAPSGSAQP